MRMDVGLDTGDIIAKKQVRIAEDETGGSLFDKLAAVGAELCVETMQMLENKTATFTPQDNEASTHTKMISKELGDIDWKKPAVEIERLIRGLNPWPSAYTHLDNKAFKIWKARVVETDGAYAPGCICKAVSYTHLDVYKRQAICRSEHMPANCPMEGCNCLEWSEVRMEAV